MSQWLISYLFRRAFRLPTGELEWSNQVCDKMEVVTVHPAIFLAEAAATYKEFAEKQDRPNSVVTCDQITGIRSVIYIPPDSLTPTQQQMLEDTYSEREPEEEACHG